MELKFLIMMTRPQNIKGFYGWDFIFLKHIGLGICIIIGTVFVANVQQYRKDQLEAIMNYEVSSEIPSYLCKNSW